MALRRGRGDDEATWTTLPAEGRTGRTPAWPLLGKASRQELAAWRRLWRTPQAVQWERDQVHERVARYVRKQLEADEPGSSSSATVVAIRMADDLGLTYSGMNRLRWRIAPNQLQLRREAKQTASGERPTPRRSARDRMRVV